MTSGTGDGARGGGGYSGTGGVHGRMGGAATAGGACRDGGGDVVGDAAAGVGAAVGGEVGARTPASTFTSAVADAVAGTHNGAEADTLAVIVAAGSGQRFGGTTSKQLAVLCGRPLVAWSVLAFAAAPSVAGIVVVCPPGRVDEIRASVIAPLKLATPPTVVAGGATRQESVACGLAAALRLAKSDGLSCGYVAVHDGARPLVSVNDIERVVAAVRDDAGFAGAVAAAPLTDTIKRVDASDAVVATVDRAQLWGAMTPQVFRADVLATAYARAAADGFVGTDDASVVEHAGGMVRCVATSRSNLKVTYPEDLAVASALMARAVA